MRLDELTCTHCQGAGLELQPDGQAVCRFCGTANALDGVVCDQCEHINSLAAEACAACHQALWRPCPACGTRNWRGAGQCQQCGGPLDSLAFLSTRWGTDPASRLNEQAHRSTAIKAQEAADADRRLAGLQAIDQRRLQILGAARQRRDVQQRALMVIMAGFIAAFAVFVGVVLLVSYYAK